MAAVELIDVNKNYGEHRVLISLGISAEPGEVVGLLGPNGVGKSTTLRIAAGATRADNGTVSVLGGSPEDTKVRRRVGFLPDVGGLFPRLNGWEHLELTGRMYGIGDWRERGGVLLERLELVDVASKRSQQLSHGLARRLGVAVATLSNPDVLLLDEPFDGVDPLAARAVRALVTERARAGAAVIVSTHLLDVAARCCDRLVVVSAGSVVATGTPEALTAGHSTLEDAYAALMGQ